MDKKDPSQKMTVVAGYVQGFLRVWGLKNAFKRKCLFFLQKCIDHNPRSRSTGAMRVEKGRIGAK